MSILHPGRQTDPEHLAKLRAYGCWCCKVDVRTQQSPTEIHHPRGGQGMGQRADDRDAIPLCKRHHVEKHPDSLSIHMNPREWRAWYGSEADVCKLVNEAIEEES